MPLARRIARRTSLPILDTGAEVIQGSDRILDWTGLPGADPDLEGRLARRVGPLLRQYLYAGTLGDPRSAADIRDALLDGVPTWQARLGRLAWPVTRQLMIRGMNAGAALLPALERDLEAELGWFDARLGDRRHLVDDRFGRADITAASLLAPLARPPERPLYRRITFPPAVEDALARWSARPCMRWVERVFTEHRR